MAGKWVQKIVPYLDDSKLTVKSGGKLLYDWCGWCLAVTDACFGVSPFAASAQVAWNVNTTKHTDRDIPQNVYVPIFWTGDRQGYGHVAVAYREGDNLKVWSSPYTHKPYFDYFDGNINSVIETIRSKYGLTSFLGWTETLGDKRIIQWEDIPEAVVVPEPTPEPAPEPTPEPAPEPEPETPATDEGSGDLSQDTGDTNTIDDNDASEGGSVKPEQPPVVISEEEANKLLEENVIFMEKFTNLVAEAGKGLNFSPLTKKIVYIVGDLLLLAGVEVAPVMAVIGAQNAQELSQALTQALFTAGVGILLIFKLLKAKSAKQLNEDKPSES